MPPPRTWLFRDAINSNLSQQRLLSSVSGGFAILALALIATGLYGILARSVVDRRREIGIRMAFGARRQQIIRNLARTAALRIAVGALAGAALAFVAGHFLQSLLYGVATTNPVIALATLAVLVPVLILALYRPPQEELPPSLWKPSATSSPHSRRSFPESAIREAVLRTG
jgi:ABC-type antimicrobial peptide transport system permease subunit